MSLNIFFLIIQENDESIEEYMERFKEEKFEITDCPNSIAIEAFRKGLLRSSNLFTELTKIVPHTMEKLITKLESLSTLRENLDLTKRAS